MERIIFQFEHLANFNIEVITRSIETQDTLYVIDLNQVNELKADIARYVLHMLTDQDNSYFMWYSAKLNQKLEMLYSLDCHQAIAKFFEYGYWT